MPHGAKTAAPPGENPGSPCDTPGASVGGFNLRVLLLLSCGHMVIDIYQGALPAILPFLKEHLGLSYTVAGTILIVSNITSSIIQPVFGFLSDRKQKAFLLPLGAFLAGTGFALVPVAQSYPLILLLVAVSGLGIAAYHPEGFKTARRADGDGNVCLFGGGKHRIGPGTYSCPLDRKLSRVFFAPVDGSSRAGVYRGDYRVTQGGGDPESGCRKGRQSGRPQT
jgi:hypothetical protein